MTANISGYPSDKASGTQWYAARTIDSSSPRKVRYDIDTAGGQSGAAVYRIKDGSRYAVAIHAYGGARVNSGTRINQAVFDNIKTWVTDNAPGMRINGVVRGPGGDALSFAAVAFVQGPTDLPDVAALTGDDGTFVLTAPVVGHYRLGFRADDCAYREIGLDVDDVDVSVTITLEAEPETEIPREERPDHESDR